MLRSALLACCLLMAPLPPPGAIQRAPPAAQDPEALFTAARNGERARVMAMLDGLYFDALTKAEYDPVLLRRGLRQALRAVARGA